MIEIKPPRERELSNGLQRQRRNVILSSVAVVLFLSLGLELEKISILGNSAKIVNTQSVPMFLIAIHLYVTLRYWQYDNEENKRGSARLVFNIDIIRYELKYLYKAARKKFLVLDCVDGFNFIFPRYENLSLYSGCKEKGNSISNLFLSKIIVIAQIYGDGKNKLFEKNIEGYSFVKGKNEGLCWKVIDKPKQHLDRSGVFIESHIELNIWLLIYCRAKAVRNFLFVNTYFSDYWLPKILASAALLLGIQKVVQTVYFV
ncbi:hypothetical protein [Pseudoalteromonas luteoviolacea]|uniref:Uncharacterized protein n=1 Tax=Pseudoalteromonas luteoviolacea S4060-1 TaxID=1365257 RepID=A0A162BS55_9GAMM|nr:hypothetical protein [Pseudoalteromonas luteoviolacea]KZN34553.1 hypothetical protein N480_21245 [Pseudoalteromonas luteoviolacea S2607]KZN67503.1 hypothetical protein N478_01765 [Pseudoalteromonas luteoviolacea S4060-1]